MYFNGEDNDKENKATLIISKDYFNKQKDFQNWNHKIYVKFDWDFHGINQWDLYFEFDFINFKLKIYEIALYSKTDL